MLILLRATILAALLVLSGCAATVSRPTSAESTPLSATATPTAVALLVTGSPAIQSSADWHTFRAEWRTAFAAAAAEAAIPASYVESEPTNQPAGTVLIRVTVNDYRYLTPGARYGFGIMTGNAYVDADAEFLELNSGRSLAKRKYGTSSSAWQGVFSAMTDKQVRALSDAMLKEILRP